MEIEDYVTYEVAKLLKEKGYDEECNAYYHNDKSNEYCGVNDGERFELCEGGFYNKCNKYRDAAPTLYEAQKWLREMYGIYVLVTPYHNSDYGKFLTFDIYRKIDCYPYLEYVNDSDDVFYFYEEALNAGIKKALEFI